MIHCRTIRLICHRRHPAVSTPDLGLQISFCLPPNLVDGLVSAVKSAIDPNADVRTACVNGSQHVGIWLRPAVSDADNQARGRGLDRLNILHPGETLAFFINAGLIRRQAIDGWNAAPKRRDGDGNPDANGPGSSHRFLGRFPESEPYRHAHHRLRRAAVARRRLHVDRHRHILGLRWTGARRQHSQPGRRYELAQLPDRLVSDRAAAARCRIPGRADHYRHQGRTGRRRGCGRRRRCDDPGGDFDSGWTEGRGFVLAGRGVERRCVCRRHVRGDRANARSQRFTDRR